MPKQLARAQRLKLSSARETPETPHTDGYDAEGDRYARAMLLLESPDLNFLKLYSF